MPLLTLHVPIVSATPHLQIPYTRSNMKHQSSVPSLRSPRSDESDSENQNGISPHRFPTISERRFRLRIATAVFNKVLVKSEMHLRKNMSNRSFRDESVECFHILRSQKKKKKMILNPSSYTLKKSKHQLKRILRLVLFDSSPNLFEKYLRIDASCLNGYMVFASAGWRKQLGRATSIEASSQLGNAAILLGKYVFEKQRQLVQEAAEGVWGEFVGVMRGLSVPSLDDPDPSGGNTNGNKYNAGLTGDSAIVIQRSSSVVNPLGYHKSIELEKILEIMDRNCQIDLGNIKP